jgi:hypothetical protein
MVTPKKPTGREGQILIEVLRRITVPRVSRQPFPSDPIANAGSAVLGTNTCDWG